MKKLARTYIIVLSVLTLLSAVILREINPEHFPPLLYTIPVFYAVMLGVMALIKRSVDKNGKDRSIFFLAYRIVKIILAIVLLLVYFTAVGEELLVFAVVFAVFYLCLSAIETALFIKGEKN